jgi:hypothetical protein
MLTFDKITRHRDLFRRLTGVDVEMFLEMCEQIIPLWENRRDNFEQGGCPHSLSGVQNHLLAMLIYYRSYISYAFLGLLFDVHETTAMRSVKRIEKLAVRVIHIEKKRELTKEEVSYLIIDATEQPVQRPKKRQKRYYSGKKKRHTHKVQLTVDSQGKIHAVSPTHPGKKHDLTVHQGQKKRDQFLGIPKKGDSGYQGMGKKDSHAQIPHKKPRGGTLSNEQKQENHLLSKERIRVENTIREVKIFRIMADPYRNRRKGQGAALQ